MAVSTHEHIHNILDEVWSIFNRAGVSEDLVIIESIAAFLLEIEHKRLSISELQPRKPELNENVAESIKQNLIIACDLVQNAGKLFDRYVLFRLSARPAKNIYPIPRHIVLFMVQIVDILPKHDFADFACGSGGFLVHGSIRSASNIGVDISPEWIRIATANIRLQTSFIINEIKLYTDDAFHICNRGDLSSQSFDRIAMVPPFGITIDPQVALQTMGITSGRASEILFIRLALKKLNEQGRAVVMLPDTLLMKRGSQQLKKEILELHTLLAVISLGEGALYPFNPQSVSILLLEKHHNPAIHPWLFNVVNDGYQRRRNRDITQDPSSPDHDLAIVESVLRAQSSLQPVPTKNNIPAYFAIAALQSTSQNTFIGFVIQTRVSVKQCSVWLIEEEQPELAARRFLLAHLSISGTSTSAQYIVIPLNQVGMQLTDIRCDDNYTVWLSNRTQMRSGSTIFSHSDEAGMISPTIAILHDGRLLGCTRSTYEITHDSYHLHPMDYLNIVGQRRSLSATELGLPIDVEPEFPLDADAIVQTKGVTNSPESIEPKIGIVSSGPEIAEDTSPSVALHKLKQQHDLIWHYANYLQDQLEMRTYTALPPRTQELSSFELLHYLGEEQRATWEAIQRMVDNQGHAYYFTIQQLQAILQTDKVQLRSSLELLEQIGVIVRVHINLLGKETTIICYRLLTEHDIVQPKESAHETA